MDSKGHLDFYIDMGLNTSCVGSLYFIISLPRIIINSPIGTVTSIYYFFVFVNYKAVGYSIKEKNNQ